MGEEGGHEATPSSQFTKRHWIIFSFFGLINLLSAMTVSIQAPFYPGEAESKGASATEYGLVFGIFECVVFLMAPIFGQFINKIGPKTLLRVSTVLNAIPVICFGLLDKIDDHTSFIVLSFLCRILEGLGFAGCVTTIFVIVACEFTSVATTFAALETFTGFGLIVGPTVGGALFSWGGFPLPFFVVGTSLLVVGVLSAFVIPTMDKATGDDGEEQKGYGILTILKIPLVSLAALSIVSTTVSLGYISATLEPHIRHFSLTPIQTGLVFIVNGGLYALLAPLLGVICDNTKKPEYITVLGNLLVCISFLFIGPASFIPMETNLWVTIGGLTVQGLGFACCFVSTFIVGLRQSLQHGLPDNVATYGVVSGMWQSMISLGAWIGPSAAGALYDTLGFRQGSWLVLSISFVAGMGIVFHAWLRAKHGTSIDSSESQSLLDGQSEGCQPIQETNSKVSPLLPGLTLYGSA